MNGLLEIASAAAVAENVADSCSLDNYLAQPDHTMDARIAEARVKLGTDVVLLGHHYQRDEVIRLPTLPVIATSSRRLRPRLMRSTCCFVACTLWRRRPDVLGQPWQQVILPDLNAGCSMADMAEIGAGRGLLGFARTAGNREQGGGSRRRNGFDSVDVYELCCRYQGVLRPTRWSGVYVVECTQGV